MKREDVKSGIIGLVICFVCVAVGVAVDRSGVDSARDFNISLLRRKAWCASMRSTLELAKHDLWSKRADDRAVGYAMFDGYRVESCAAESYVGFACDGGDRACVVNAIDWALVNIR